LKKEAIDLKSVLVTGGAGGIGSEIVNRYSLSKWNVIAPTRKELDFSSYDSIKMWVESSQKSYDAIILCAAQNRPQKFLDVDINIMTETMLVNAINQIALIQLLLKNRNLRRYVKIVAISSTYSILSRSGRLAYSASKSALESYIRTIALEMAESKVLANIIRPGFVDTTLTRKNNTNEEIRNIINQIPLNTLAKANEIAELFLPLKKIPI
jgi:3-oxoacyl-[acyl-carrier protein] reductase